MKKIVNLFLVLFPVIAISQTTTENYIKNITYNVKTQNGTNNATTNAILTDSDKLQTINYFDGLGRPIQQVGYQLSPSGRDIVTPIEYDGFGRQVKEYLPYVPAAAASLTYKTTALTEVGTFYNTSKYENTANPYSLKELEASPLNRILKQAAPGYDWRMGGGHEIRMDYQTNASNEVINWEVSLTFADNTYTPTLSKSTVNNGFYNSSQLYKTITKDENWQSTQTDPNEHTSQEFKDKEGRVILKRTFAKYGTATISEKHDTYYVYDIYGNLTFVIPPKAVDVIGSGSTGILANQTSSLTITAASDPLHITATNSIRLLDGFKALAGSTFSAKIVAGDLVLNQLCYQYKYDHRNRLVEKKLPGKDWEYIIYDKLDRPVLTQDANLREKKKWLFTKYDAFGRPVYTGDYTNTVQTTRILVQGMANGTVLSENRQSAPQPIQGTTIHYTNNAFPNLGIDVMTINYYDDYLNFDLLNGTAANAISYGVIPIANAKGLSTCTKVRVLDTTPAQWITNVVYYDDKARPIYNYNKNTFLDVESSVKSDLDFTGKVIETTTTHQKGSQAIITIVDKYTYDHGGRMLTQQQKINTQTPEMIVSNSYDSLGQLITKEIGGKTNQARLQTVDYTYNIRGWLKGINDTSTSNNSITMAAEDLFGFKINYNNPSSGQALYNGNISQTYWKSTNPIDTSLRNYTYSYDALNRLSSAVDNLTRYNESMGYDKNGNIMSLTREGNTNDANIVNFGTMDILAYTYLGNRLNTVEDSSGSTEGFKDGSHTAQEYTYDDNGNMKTDDNKGITAITYNHLNLPTEVIISGGTIKYAYDATGVKQRKTIPGTVTDYAGGFQYEKIGSNNEVLRFFPTAEGYAEKNSMNGTFSYIYQYKDHLGNVRLSYKDNNNDNLVAASEIVEENSYYPFGLKQKVQGELIINSGYKYKYNGKELQDDNIGGVQLNLYDYGARNYDPALGRWMNVDPLVEKYLNISPYAYVANNAINAIDPDGKKIIFVVRGETRKQYQQLTYRKGNFYHENGKRYNPGKESLSPTLYKLLTAYRAIEKSNDKVLKNKLHTLENSKQNHYIEKGADHQNEVGKDPHNTSVSDAEKKVKDGVPVDTQTFYNFSDATKKRLAELQGVPDDDLSIVTHEMSHEYDYDQGQNGDSVGVPASAESPTEIRAVKTENRARKISGLPKRTTYGGDAIDPKKLNN